MELLFNSIYMTYYLTLAAICILALRNQTICKDLGLLFLYWGVSYVPSLYWAYNDIHDPFLMNLTTCFDLWSVYLTVWFFSRSLNILDKHFAGIKGWILFTPFFLFTLAYLFSKTDWILVCYNCFVIGFSIFYCVRAIRIITRYHKAIKANYSSTENISPNWMKNSSIVMLIFFLLWSVRQLTQSPLIIHIYPMVVLCIWFYIFIHSMHYKNIESQEVFEAAEEEKASAEDEHAAIEAFSQIELNLNKLMESEKVFLQPQLKMSDLAIMINTNRTYLSRYFSFKQTSFYDYMNNLRIEYACKLLYNKELSVEEVALQSGFCSLSTFNRNFMLLKNVSASKYRKSNI